MSPIDLHVHTSHSHDGDVDAAAIVHEAARLGIRCLAVTDHNRVSAVAPALDAAAGRDIEIIPGIEIDCRHEGIDLHLLGYHIDHADPRYAAFWEARREVKVRMNRGRMDAFRNLGFVFDEARLLAESREGVVSSVAIAGAILADPANDANPALADYRPGAAKAHNPVIAFCWDYTAQGKPAYIENSNPALAEALELITATGGVPVLAHPGSSLKGREDALASIVAAGVPGVEAFCGYHDPGQARRWMAEAARLGAFFTCGSDFHGSAKPGIRLGEHGGDGHEDAVLASLRDAARA